MGWEQRLREMVLAGGALAATACGASTATPTDAGSDATSSAGDDGSVVSFGCCNANSDPCCALSCGPEQNAASYMACEENRTDCGVNETFGQLVSGDMGCVSLVQSGCCNANPDPCCPIGYCSPDAGPDSSAYIDCEQDRSECEALDASYGFQGDGIGCSVPLGPGDAGPTYGDSGCCNANPDPCCFIGYCPAGAGLDSSAYFDCRQRGCEAQDASYGLQPDGSMGCSVPTGVGDAGPDAEPGDAGPGDAEAGP
jgi:hypothetical protein